MARIKIKHESNYTVVQNDFIYDKALSTFDKGLLLVMLSKKDDYNFSVERISKEIGETRQKVSKSLRVIEKSGYLERKQTIHNKKFGEMIYYISDVPCLGRKKSIEDIEIEKVNRLTEIRNTENASTVMQSSDSGASAIQPDILNTDKSNTKISSTYKSNIEVRNKKPAKKNFAEVVTLTDKEYENLCKNHNKPFADKCIEVLNNYKKSHGKKYDSDYHTILNWVISKVSKEFPQLIQTNLYENPFARYIK